MNRLTILLISLLVTACHPRTARQSEDFNFDWRFTLGDDTAYSSADYDDGAWRSLHLPHDWAIEGEFAEDNPSLPSGGALPGGIGWYRKHFTAPEGRIVSLEFDGVFMNSTVWVNGQQVGHRPYGYSSFSYNITPYLRAGAENVVAVRCDNSEQPNSRWYAGCGIYRPVRLVATAPLAVDYSGTWITTPEVSDKQATARIATTLVNKHSQPQHATLRHVILDHRGRCVGMADMETEIAPGKQELVTEATIRKPRLWDTEDPYLYTVETIVEQDGERVDDYRTRFGIRTFDFSADKGFSLNGRREKIRGVCMHHDMGALGAAVHRRALERQLEILREMGCNAIRTSHNPPTPLLLDLCDSMGFLVMDEALDMWRKPKTQYDYARYFDAWHERDVADFIRRDRNHPSVIIWSAGNEIPEQWGDDTTSVELTRHMVELIKSLDPTRPVTAGCDHSDPSNNLLRSGALDIIGFNYRGHMYDSVPVWFPGKPFVGSETVSSVQSRGFYLHPSDSVHIAPVGVKFIETPHHQLSAYDNSRVPWGEHHERSWIAIRDRDYASGTFIWTGFDYLGEPTPYSWPSRSSYFGIVDLCGFPKDVYYMYRSEWTDNTTLHLFPHWNWSEGEAIDLWAYYNNADEVELLVNGRSQGRQSKSADRLHCIWRGVAFEPGEITAVSYKDGREVARVTHRTAGAPSALRLTADRRAIESDGYDLAFVTVDAVDDKGNFCPTAMDGLQFEVEGAGELVGVDNGNAAGGQCLKGDRMNLFNGKALAIVRSKRGVRGAILLTVEGDRVKGKIHLRAK